MSDPKQHIVVEGVEFSELFHFPKVLGEAASAFQPGRLVIGLFMVVVLLTAGQIWDASTTPRVHPAGLLSGTWTDSDRDAAEPTLRAALGAFSPESLEALDAAPDGSRVDPRTILDMMATGYRRGLDELDEPSRESRAQRYSRMVAQVDAIRPRGVFESVANLTNDAFTRIVRGALLLPDGDVHGGARDLFVGMPDALWRHHRSFSIVFGLVLATVLAIGGGALSRMTACQRAGMDRLSVIEAFLFAFESWPRLLGALLLPVLLALVFSVVLAVLAFVFMLPWIDVLGGLLYGVALLIGLAIVFLLAGYLIGFVMLVPAVACEKCDAADAQQRAYAYVLNRPLHLLGYLFVGVIGLALGYLVAGFLASAVVNGTAMIGNWLSANPALDGAGGFAIFDATQSGGAATLDAWHERWLAGAVTFWQALVSCLVGGYVFAYLFGASTTVYLLMRRQCDGQDFDEIWCPGQVPGTCVGE